MFVRSAKTDALATEVQRAKAKGIEHPFVYTELAKILPLCARGASGSPDEDEPKSREAAALAKALGRGAAAESQPLLAWTQWHQAYDAWCIAAAVTDQLSYVSALAHKHVVLQAIGRWSALRRRGRALAGCLGCPSARAEAQVAFRLARRTWAERAAAGVAGFKVDFSTVPRRDVFARAASRREG